MGNRLSYRPANSTSRRLAATLVPCALGVISIAACSDGGDVSSDQLDQHVTLAPKGVTKLPQYNLLKPPHFGLPGFPHVTPPKTPAPKPPTTGEPKPGKPPEPKGNDAGPVCKNPNLGAPGNLFTVGNTAAFIARCQSMGCPGGPGPDDVALDYGEFPFRGANFVVNGSFFYAVVAPGDEDDFMDGAPGNLSDTTASSSPGDRGSGDTEADRTITANALSSVLFPSTHGTHAISFPPSQFEAIALSPFDVPPDGHCELAICPTSATTRCDCAFARFDVPPTEGDGGTTGGTGGTTSTGGTTHSAGGTTHGDGGHMESTGGTTHGAGGSGGTACDP